MIISYSHISFQIRLALSALVGTVERSVLAAFHSGRFMIETSAYLDMMSRCFMLD